jgi:hypothetical protein
MAISENKISEVGSWQQFFVPTSTEIQKARLHSGDKSAGHAQRI